MQANRDYYIDVTTIRKDLDEARKEAIERSEKEGRKIVALYNSKRDQTVYLWDDNQERGYVQGNIGLL